MGNIYHIEATGHHVNKSGGKEYESGTYRSQYQIIVAGNERAFFLCYGNKCICRYGEYLGHYEQVEEIAGHQGSQHTSDDELKQ